MLNPRYKPVVFALTVLAVVWVVAVAGFRIAQSQKMTADKFREYAATLDFNRLSGEKRARALSDLAAKLNRLPADERRKARMERAWDHLFQNLSEQEKSDFIDATMPTGFKQMIASFEQLTPEKRKKAIDDSIRRLRTQRDAGLSPDQATNRSPPLSEELQKKILTTGLKTFYIESSAQTKAEAAPLLEEIQRTMESGRLFRPRP